MFKAFIKSIRNKLFGVNLDTFEDDIPHFDKDSYKEEVPLRRRFWYAWRKFFKSPTPMALIALVFSIIAITIAGVVAMRS